MCRAGRDVLVLEARDARGKNKLCGGILGQMSLEELANIYGEEALGELDLTYPSHLRTRCLDKETCSPIEYCTIERKRLDDWLLARYLSGGGALRDHMRLLAIDESQHVATCVHKRTGERLEITYGTLVGADGAFSAVRKLATGRRQRTIWSVQGDVPLCGEDIVFGRRMASQGYCWYIPTGSVANVGCGSSTDDVRACREWLNSFCEGLGIELPALRGAPIPTGDDLLFEAGEDIWLVGDAAGLASPYDSGGIHYALASARLLAESLLGHMSYEEAMRPISSVLAQLAARKWKLFFCANLLTARKGVPFKKGE